MSRRFGVEIEHKQPKLMCSTACSISNVNHLSCQSTGLTKILSQEFPRWAPVTYDGSGCEVRSPVLCGDDDMKELEAVMNMLKELGGRVYQADGLHVHHDAPEYLVDDDKLAYKRICTLAQSWCNNQAIINDLVSEHRRADWFKCEMAGYGPTSCYKQVTQKVVDAIKNTSKPVEYTTQDYRQYRVKPKDALGRMNDRMYALNVAALATHGTIEVRQYQGTLNFDRARAWIRFGQCFIDTVLQDDNTPIAPYESIDDLMKDMGLDSFERGILMEVGT